MAVFSVISIIMVLFSYIALFFRFRFSTWILVFPFTLILVKYLKECWHAVPYPNAVEVDLCIAASILVSSIVFFFAYYHTKTTFCETIAKKFFLLPNSLSSYCMKNSFKIVILLGGIYLVLFWYSRIQLYGSFSEAAFAMYATAPDIDVPPLSARLALYFFSFFALVASYRFFLCFSNENVQIKSIEWILVFLIVISHISTGNRGQVIKLPLFIFFTMLLVKAQINQKLLHVNYTHLKTIGLFLFGFFLFLMLSDVRKNKYESFTEFYNDINVTTFVEGGLIALQINENSEKEGGVSDTVAKSMQIYGNTQPYLGLFYTPYVIATNLIPREYWKSKPNGYGRQIVLDYYDLEDSRHSVGGGTFGEGYAAYGYIGGFFYTILFALINGVATKFFVVLVNGAFDSIEYWIFGLGFYNISINFIRGDMLSSWAQSVYPLLFFVIIIFSINFFSKRL